MKILTMIALCFAFTACSLASPTCRYAEGPVKFNFHADAMGGMITGETGEKGRFLSYPATMDGSCPPPTWMMSQEQ